MAAARTAKQKAALRKAQLASARKRRGKGKGKLASANRRYSSSARANRNWHRVALGAAAIGVGVAVGRAVSDHKNQRRKRDYVNNRRSSNMNYKMASDSLAQHSFKRKTAPKAHSGKATAHNRVFATSRHGVTSVRKRY